MANTKVEDAMMKRLQATDLNDGAIKKLSASIATMQSNGFLIDQVLVRGKPSFNNVLVKGTVNPEAFGKIVLAGGLSGKFRGFPIGLPAEGFRVNVELNATH